jgi:diketogulonate reductase-like aldo/keto reductase
VREKAFGPAGVIVSVIGQGTWNMPENGPRLTQAKQAIRRGIDLGMTHIDTAEMYGSGRVEQLLAGAIEGFPREQLFIATKVLPSNASFRGTVAAADRSLRSLKLEYLDLYLLHWPSSYPLEETMRALESLVEQGKARFVGVSNFDAGEMLEAKSYLRGIPLACNQVLYNLHERGVEHELVPVARKNGIAVVAYTPFARGALSREPAESRATLDAIARKHQATPRQVILAFLTREPNVFTIPKASTIEHVEENAAAGDLVLDSDDLDAIDRAFPRGEPGPLAML